VKKIKWLILSFAVVLVIVGLFFYQKMTDDTYQGMSIIPEQHKDIPLYKGLNPTNHKYIIEGNHWKQIYDFYLLSLPSLGWKVEYEGSTLDDKNALNDIVGGFSSRWRKEGFNGELFIAAHYNQLEDQTQVIFDKHPIFNSTAWINNIPSKICVYQSKNDEKCNEIKDKTKIDAISSLVNNAIDWSEQRSSREHTSLIDFGTITLTVFYESDKEIYFVSEKGTKLMKPEHEFFELTNLQR
jgi:hypothetical protein